MSAKPTVSFSHSGVYVSDVDKMVDFYTRVLGFVVSDRGINPAGHHVVFMTTTPEDHHQFVITGGRPKEATFNSDAQFAFRVDSLATLRLIHAANVESGHKTETRTHGNAMSVYVYDPEGHRIEFLIDTPWHVPQPFATPVDFSLDDEQLWKLLEEKSRARPGFKPRKEWKNDIAERLAKR